MGHGHQYIPRHVLCLMILMLTVSFRFSNVTLQVIPQMASLLNSPENV